MKTQRRSEERELNQARSKPNAVDRPVRTSRPFVHHYNSTQYCNTETVLSIFPFLQTNITSQMWPNGGKRDCTTTNLPLCNDTIILLKITLLHSVSIITNFVVPKYAERETDRHRINTTFSSTAGTRPTITTILGIVIEEVRAIFAPH